MELNLFESETILNFISVAYAIKLGVLIILVFYAIFALMIIRQVDLMRKTLITPVSKLLSAISIIHAGFTIGLIVLAWRIM